MVRDDLEDMRITVTENGPYEVTGGVPLLRLEILTNESGESVGWREIERIATGDSYLLCRCGMSANKPFCDASHLIEGFEGAETAAREAYREVAVCSDGSGVRLRDVRQLCAEARFCDRGGGLWNLIERTGEPDVLALVIEEAGLCPSGRYVACDPDSDEAIEPQLELSIGVVEDPYLRVRGPLFVRGGIPVYSADGTPYEVRNRVTLCRCGNSGNKPFCDGTHVGTAPVHED